VTLPLLVVCEDGTDYTNRFSRFLGGEFNFVRAGHLAEARVVCLNNNGARALLMDLDFRRTPCEHLIDETGAPAAPPEAPRVAAMQGILILRALRAAGNALPALLFADLPDDAQRDFLARNLAPLIVVPSGEGLPTIAARLRALR
jgi:hypothetical protein